MLTHLHLNALFYSSLRPQARLEAGEEGDRGRIGRGQGTQNLQCKGGRREGEGEGVGSDLGGRTDRQMGS